MKTISPYITFGGNCREAMEFYHMCLGGKLFLQTVGGSPLSGKLPAGMKKLILHAVLSNKTFVLMGSDMVHDDGLVKGNAVSIVLGCDNEAEVRACYKRLSEGGHQTQALAMSVWGTLTGGLTDRYGNYWALNQLKNETVR